MAIKKSDIYRSLWDSCDQLRGGMDASLYKDYILTLLFLKYVSDRAGQPDALIEVPEGCSFDDTYIRAEDSEVISHLDDISLIDLVESKGASALDDLPPASTRKRENAADAIENNVRKLIVEESPVNPRFYEKMSELLTDLIRQRREDAIDYAEYLERIADLVRAAKAGHGGDYPDTITTAGQKALYDNLGNDEALTLKVDRAVRETAPFGWRGNRMRERKVWRCLQQILDDPDDLERVFEILKNQNEY